MPEDKQLEGTIRFWESKLESERYLMDISSQTLVQQTVDYLKELQKRKEAKVERQR